MINGMYLESEPTLLLLMISIQKLIIIAYY